MVRYMALDQTSIHLYDTAVRQDIGATSIHSWVREKPDPNLHFNNCLVDIVVKRRRSNKSSIKIILSCYLGTSLSTGGERYDAPKRTYVPACLLPPLGKDHNFPELKVKASIRRGHRSRARAFNCVYVRRCISSPRRSNLSLALSRPRQC
jgi:hypothetical protein